VPKEARLWQLADYALSPENMLRFGTRKSHDWHEKVNITTRNGGLPTVLGSLNPAFPWATLCLHTDRYLAKKGNISSEERDRRLSDLITSHRAKDIAVAACAHRMSPEALRSFMADELNDNTLSVKLRESEVILLPNHVRFLQAIVTVHHVNPLALAESDSRVAQALLRCSLSESHSTSHRLETVMKLLIAGIPDNSFVYPYAKRMAHGYAAKLSGEMENLKESCEWLKAHAETKWLSMLLTQPLESQQGRVEAAEILEEQFSDWKLWAEWTDIDSRLAEAIEVFRRPQRAVRRSTSLGFWKKQLTLAWTISSINPSLKILIEGLVTGLPNKASFVYRDACDLMATLSGALSFHLKTLKDSHEWLTVHAVTEWLSILLDHQSSPGAISAIALLEQHFPDWKVWAEWSESDTNLAKAVAACRPADLAQQSTSMLDFPLPVSPTALSASQKLERLVKAHISGGPKKNPYLCREASQLMLEYSIELSCQIQTLKESQEWIKAHVETEWLSVLLEGSIQSSPPAVEVTKLLTERFPGWRAWAEWDECDTKLAWALIPCFKADTMATSRNFEIVMGQLMVGVSIQSVLHSEVHSLARKFSIDLADQLHTLQQEGQWFKARKESEWLPTLLDESSEHLIGRAEAIQALEVAFLDWRPWATWRPDIDRLSAQERLNAEQRASLTDLLRLEGPDFMLGQQVTMREALIARYAIACRPLPVVCWGKIRLKVQNVQNQKARRVEAEELFKRLSMVVHLACMANAREIELLKYLCYGRKIIDENALNILWASILLGNSMPTISADVLLILQPQIGPQGRSSQMAAVMRLLPVLGQSRAQALRDALSSHLVSLISSCIREMQDMLSMQLENPDRVQELHTFGMGVQAAQWLYPLLIPSLGSLIRNWTSAKKIRALQTLQIDVLRLPCRELVAVRSMFNAYYTECLIERGTIDPDTKALVEALIQLWHENPDDDRKRIALMVACVRETGSSLRCECLRQLLTAPDEFIHGLHQMLQSYTKSPDDSCIKVVRLLSGAVPLDHGEMACWRSLIYSLINERNSSLLEYALTHLDVHDWFHWLSDIQTIFTGMVIEDTQISSSIFQPALHEWAHRTGSYWPTIGRLERLIGSGPATQCLLVGFESGCSESVMQILKLLESYFQESDDGQSLQPAVQATIALLDRANGGNAKEICLVLSMLTHTTQGGNEAYLRVLEVCQHVSQEAAHVLLVVWHRHPDLSIVDQWALEALGSVLYIHLPNDDSLIMNALDAAGGYVTSQVTSLLAEARELARLRRSLKNMDPEGTSALLAEFGISDASSPLEDEIARLPAELVDVIEIVAEDIVELHFPLTHFTALQKAGMGTSNSQSLIVRVIVGSASLPSGFCMHFDDEMKDIGNSNNHSPWLVLDDCADGGTSSCHGRANRATFQLGYILSLHLLEGQKSLEETYKLLKRSLDTLTQKCIICGTNLGIKLRRSATCESPFCSSTFLVQANIDIQLYDLQEDIQVGELLLTAVQAAATSGNTALLPECPVGQAHLVTDLLGTVAQMAAMEVSASNDLHAVLRRSGKRAVGLLRWIFGHYGGFLVSASGQMRIPSMPGVHQFLLANAAPSLETAFAAQMGNLPSRVVFHGTSLDRLYSILCQGLRVCSGDNSLQRHGASFGHGIYVADEPTTAIGFAHVCSSPAVGSGWHSSTFRMVNVLLGCEASGNIPAAVSGGYHVISNPNMLILRYIFLVPAGTSLPIARHIVPAMASVFASLRSGSL
jgi:Poly(ADP-ribose) polymerase catalytic domain